MTQAPQAGPAVHFGEWMYDLIERAYPICRSITGDGLRRTLQLIQEHIPLTLTEIPTGTRVLDWEIPREWNIRDAYVADESGRRLIDFREHNLHVVNYSAPVRRRMRLDERLHTLVERPDWIPYKTTYYKEDWGFCLSARRLAGLRADEDYEVVIDSTLEPGALSYGEWLLQGRTDEEILISSHCCHPSLCNDNLTGIAVAVALARMLRARPTRYSYRFLFAPGTIGAIAWLARNPEAVQRVRHGLVLALLGDPGPQTYKRSRRGDALIDRAATHVLGKDRVRDFDPEGYDERQYCSPGFDLPAGRLTRSPHGEYPEYHTSADNLDLVRPEYLEKSLTNALAILDVVERNRVYRNRFPFGEPQLGRRGLYAHFGGDDGEARRKAVLWVLSMSDGGASLLDIAERAGVAFAVVADAADLLLRYELIEEAA
jgi:aminopeptidase-like protein